ncbi:MAG: phosphoenolpyruvate carboxykinase (ATP), partial [Candidatus Saccharimonadales bacterium]
MIEHVAFNGQRVNLVSDTELARDRFETLSKTITGMEVVEAPKVEVEVPRVEYSPANTISIEYDESEKAILVKGPLEHFSRGDALLYISEYLATCLQSAQKGTFITHAAAVYDSASDGSTVLFGEKGAGKTTVALRLCMEGGMQLIGNDQIYLGTDGVNLTTEGGNQWFNIRETAIKSDAFLSSIFTTKSRDKSKPAWNDKVRIDLDDLAL